MPSPSPSRTVLIELPERVVVFLRAVGGHAGIRAVMADGGYTEADHRQGCELLVAVCAFGRGSSDPRRSDPARQAMNEIDSWLRTHRRRLEVAVARLHPEETALFEGLDVSNPGEALVAMATLIARVEALTGAREAVRRTLECRGFDESTRRALSRSIEIARSFPDDSDDTGALREDRTGELERLYQWHSDWAATARALIRRRDYLQMLGLARRRRAQSEAMAQSEA